MSAPMAYQSYHLMSNWKFADSSCHRMNVLVAAGSEKVEEFWMSMFFASGKYLLDILYGLEFSRKYQDNLVLNQKYEKAGEKSLWGLNEES